MPNNSATGGYLTPSVSPAPLEGEALENVLQAAIVAISGVSASLVRPRWQPKPPKTPEATVDWCAFGITASQRKGLGPALSHNPNAASGAGVDTLRRNEDIDVLLSFYGPNSAGVAARVADGFAIPQNTEVLKTNLMSFINSDTIRQVPELINEQWVKRQDLPLHFRRRIVREYAVLNIASADVEVTPD